MIVTELIKELQGFPGETEVVGVDSVGEEVAFMIYFDPDENVVVFTLN
jgi:hypothetical protein